MGDFTHEQLRAMFCRELGHYFDVVENMAKFRGCDVRRQLQDELAAFDRELRKHLGKE